MADPHSNPKTVKRTARRRLYPGDAETGQRLEDMAEGCRLLWNELLGRQERYYAMWRVLKIGKRPSVSYPALSRRITDIRHSSDKRWLRSLPLAPADLPVKVMQAVAKDLSLAYTVWFRRMKAGEPGGKPRFKPWDDTVPSFGINAPGHFTIDGNAIRLPKLGWMRLSVHDQYAGHKAKAVRIRMEGTKARPRWFAYIVYEVPVKAVQQGAQAGALGLDRNVGQATDNEGTVYRLPDTSDLDPKIKRYQRRMARQKKGSNRRKRTGWKLRKLQRKRSRRRESTCHAHTRRIADTAHTVVLEDLNIQGMTKAGKGTGKRGLNREIQASGWGALNRQLAYKAGRVVKVDPAYTSQTCSQCGHVDRANRPAQHHFQCTACGYFAHADQNAAVNILVRAGLPHRTRQARGCGASARRGALRLCGPGHKRSPTTREQVGLYDHV